MNLSTSPNNATGKGNVMTFPDSWPANCPPHDAEDADGEVYRIVKNDPPHNDDYVTALEADKLRNRPACLRCGLSVFRAYEDAVHQQRLFPKLGDMIAKGVLNTGCGKTKQTGNPTHTTWWPYDGVGRARLFSVVREEG